LGRRRRAAEKRARAAEARRDVRPAHLPRVRQIPPAMSRHAA